LKKENFKLSFQAIVFSSNYSDKISENTKNMSMDRFSMVTKVPQKSPRCKKLRLKFIKKDDKYSLKIFSSN